MPTGRLQGPEGDHEAPQVSSVQDPEQFSAQAVIANSRGMHARPCHAVVRLALAFGGAVEIACEGRRANAKSILELMTLSAGHGCVLEFQARGPGAEELVRSLVGLVEAGFQESD